MSVPTDQPAPASPSPRRHRPSSKPIEELVGIGPVSARWLREAGVCTEGDLQRLGSVEVYLMVLSIGAQPNGNLLWALEGASQRLHWTLIPPRRREELRDEVDRRLGLHDGASDTPAEGRT